MLGLKLNHVSKRGHRSTADRGNHHNLTDINEALGAMTLIIFKAVKQAEINAAVSATSHYLRQCWPSSPTHIWGTRGDELNMDNDITGKFDASINARKQSPPFILCRNCFRMLFLRNSTVSSGFPYIFNNQNGVVLPWVYHETKYWFKQALNATKHVKCHVKSIIWTSGGETIDKKAPREIQNMV